MRITIESDLTLDQVEGLRKVMNDFFSTDFQLVIEAIPNEKAEKEGRIVLTDWR